MLWLGVLTMLVAVVSPLFDAPARVVETIPWERSPGRGARLARRVRRILADPVLYIALAFLALLVVQYANAGRSLLYDYDRSTWVYAPPRIPWLPSAVMKEEAREMLYWFVPAFAVLLAVRNGLRTFTSVLVLFWLILGNALLLSLFGIAQYLSGTSSIYWLVDLPVHFFASFGYKNHAGAYFLLVFCLALAMVPILFVKRPRWSHRAGIMALGVLLVCALLSVHMSLSRASILSSWAVVAIAMGWFLVVMLRSLPPATRVNLVAAFIGILTLAYFAVAGASDSRLTGELTSLVRTETYPTNVDERWWQTESALRIWRDHPLFGVGGWGYRHFAAMYVPVEQWRHVTAAGKANAHNDAAQFLAEFGALGFGLLAAAAAVTVAPLLRKGRWWKNGTVFFTLLGAATAVAHSLIDLPFRCPAVATLWFAMLAGAAALVRLHAQDVYRQRTASKSPGGLIAPT
jgi:O-antigen ligase